MTESATAPQSTADRPVLGIDIGGSGIKGAPVDLAKGEFAADRLRFDTPSPSTPENVAKIVGEIVDQFADQIGDGPIGVTIPAIVMHGVTRSAANIDKSWVDYPAEKTFEDTLGRAVVLVNDADAAGVAEMQYGAAKGRDGVVLLTTLGTGIGTALINDGALVPNTEFGHIEIDGHDAEKRASAKYKEDKDLSYKHWAKKHLQKYYETIEFLLSPDVILVGGGVSKKADKFLPLLELNADILPAQLQNSAGIVGAAWLAANRKGS